MTMRRVDVNLDELDQIIDRSTRAPLSETEGQKLKTALHAMAERLLQKRSTEKTNAVLPPDTAPVSKPDASESSPSGHGRNSDAAFRGGERVAVEHAISRRWRCRATPRGSIPPGGAGQSRCKSASTKVSRHMLAVRCTIVGPTAGSVRPSGVQGACKCLPL